MPSRVRLTEIQHALVTAAMRGKHDDNHSLGKAMGVDGRKASQIVGNAEKADIVTIDRSDDGRLLFPTLKVTKRGRELHDATEVSAPKAKPGPKPRTARAAKAAARAAVLAPAEVAIEDSISVTFSPAEVAELTEFSDKLAALVSVLRAQPKLGPKGAAAMQLIAQLMAGG